jgi:hypothetical protein
MCTTSEVRGGTRGLWKGAKHRQQCMVLLPSSTAGARRRLAHGARDQAPRPARCVHHVLRHGRGAHTPWRHAVVLFRTKYACNLRDIGNAVVEYREEIPGLMRSQGRWSGGQLFDELTPAQTWLHHPDRTHRRERAIRPHLLYLIEYKCFHLSSPIPWSREV